MSVRILQLNPYHYPFMGGIEHRIHHMSRRLAKNHEVFVVTSRLPGTEREEVIDGYRVIRLDSKFIDVYNPPFVSSAGVLEALGSIVPDMVDFHYRWAPSYTRDVMRYKGKVVYTSHNAFGEGQGAMHYVSYLNDWLFMRRMRRFDKVICVSDFLRRDFCKHGLPYDRMAVLPNGVEMPSCPTREGDFVLSLGRMVPPKGLKYLIQAMREVDAKLIVAGSGPEKEKMQALVKKYGLTGKVSFLGRVSEEKKQELFASCKFFVMPSLSEAYGIAAAEAMSFGKTVVASNIGGLPEVVGDCGVLVPPKDSAALSREMNALLANDQRRQEMGRRARERAPLYSWDRMAMKLEKIYLDIIGNPGQ